MKKIYVELKNGRLVRRNVVRIEDYIRNDGTVYSVAYGEKRQYIVDHRRADAVIWVCTVY